MWGRGLVTAFLRSRQGMVAPIFAISSLLVFGAVGLSIDGARVYSAQQRMQSSVDAAVLAAARRASLDGNTHQVEEAFARFLAASTALHGVALRPVSPDLTQPKRISAELVGDMPTLIMPILGFNSVEVRASASAEFGFSKLEIALALDNTASMAGTRLAALKDAANRMVDTLLDRSDNDGDIRVSLVPFAQYVNVGLDNRGAPWLSVADDYSQPAEWCGDVRPEISRSNCRTVSYTYMNDGRPVTGTYEQCDIVYGDPVYQCSSWTNFYTWNGCVGSRAYPLNIGDSDYATRVPGVLNVSCPSRIQQLTSSRSDLHNAIDGMVAVGETYIPAGLTWGWRSLTSSQPYAESAGERSDGEGNRIKKVLVLMTDGENTKSPNYPDHEGADAAMANSLTAESCAAVKSAGVSIFTISFEVTSEPIKALLRGCATAPGNFYDAANAGQLDAAMQAISAQLGDLRLTN